MTKVRYAVFDSYPDADEALEEKEVDIAVVEWKPWEDILEGKGFCHLHVLPQLVEQVSSISEIQVLLASESKFTAFICNGMSAEETLKLLEEYFDIEDLTDPELLHHL